jgi:immune inhibitor A
LAVIAASVTIAAAGAYATTALATSNPTPTIPSENEPVFSDDLPNAQEIARREAREQAIAGVLTGEYRAYRDGPSTVVDLGPDAGSTPADAGQGRDKDRRGPRGHGHGSKPRYVELAREATDQIFVVLVEFGDTPPSFALDPNAQRHEGPLHNEIPEPDRSVDNSTVWRSDFSQSYFDDLYFGGGESLKNYYEAQSSGRYSLNGTVTNWVKVNFTQGRYGTDACGSIVCSTVYLLVRDATKVWVQDQLAAGRSMAEIQAELNAHDVWDRYDQDSDGDFNEPDGFLDHFQIVHAGGDQADGDPIYASDAIWSHRSYAGLAYGPSCMDNDDTTACQVGTPVGGTISAGNCASPTTGGCQIVQDGTFTGLLVGDYTMQPENGGRSVFYHEYAHDLGLPDDYNNINGGDNNNEHWTLMAQSRLGGKRDAAIGERGGDLGAWNKLQLGWLDYEAVAYDERRTLTLGPQEFNNRDPQALVVVLPDYEASFDMGEPASGDQQFYSGHADDSLIALTRQVTVPDGGGTLTLKTRYDIEVDFDRAFVAVDGTPIVGTVNGQPTQLPENQNGWTIGWEGTANTYQDGVFPLPEGTHEIMLAYQTDAAVSGNPGQAALDGVFFDAVAINGVELSEDGWTNEGFSLVGAEVVEEFSHFYIAGSRSYLSYDKYLKTGPYYFGYNPTFPDKVDHYSYQEGLLISYNNLQFSNNDTFEHPGAGRNLYIDAHPQPFARASGELWRARIQVYDAPFGLGRTDRVKIHHNGALETFGGLRGNPVFRDTDKYFFEELPNHGVLLPGYGVTIRVLSEDDGKIRVRVN